MGAPKKLEKPVYITTVLEEYQHEALRLIAYKKRRPMAELVREALERFIEEESILEKETKQVAMASH